jgi:nucleoid-associated protein YgaU
MKTNRRNLNGKVISVAVALSEVVTLNGNAQAADSANQVEANVVPNAASNVAFQSDARQPASSAPTASIQQNDFPGISAMPGNRRDLFPGEAPEIYTVEEGDTMFDICDQLINDGSYWPKLWSLNSDVQNPHFIYPGMQLAFFAGDTENPPKIEVVSEDEVVPVEKGGVEEAELVSQGYKGLEKGTEGRSVKVITGLDEGAIIEVIGPADVIDDPSTADGIIFAGKTFSAHDVSIVIPAFIVADKLEPLGEVISGATGERLIGDDKNVFFQLENDSQGGTFTVLRPSGKVYSSRSGDRIGYRYEFSAHIRTSRKHKDGVFEGVVFDSKGGIQPGDIVVNFMSTHRRIPLPKSGVSPTAAQSSVIGFAEYGKTSGAPGDYVLLEKGGLSVGGYYPIYNADDTRDLSHLSKDARESSSKFLGVAKVVDITGEAALAMIVSGTFEVRTGDTLYQR